MLRIRSLNFSSNCYRLIWYWYLFWQPLCLMMHLFSTLVVGDIMSGWQDILMLKLALQLVGDQSPIGRKSIVDKSQTSWWGFHSQYIYEIGRRQIGDRSATVRRVVGDWSPTSRKPLQLVSDRNQSRLVFCAYSKDWPRLILYGYRSPTLLRPCCYLCKTFLRPLQPLYDCQFF